MKTILLVDDDDHVREVAQMCLEMMGGWRVIAVASGADAVEAAERLAPDAILLDVMMPDMDGPATFHELRRIPGLGSVPIVFLTAKVQPSELRVLDELGAAGVLPKPFDPVTLSAELARVLGWSS
jgi:CheY-like chemotaxis protein